MLLWSLLACHQPVDTDRVPVETDVPAETDTDVPVETDTDDTNADTDLQDTDPSALIEDLAVAPHPDVATLLVVSWTQGEAATTWVTWDFEEATFTSPQRERGPGTASEVMLGLPAAVTVPVTLHVSVDGTETTYDAGQASTGPLPTDLVVPTLRISEPGAEDFPYFLTSINVGRYNFYGPCYTVILDRQGRVIWYRPVSGNRLTLFPRVSRRGGYLLWDATTYYVGGDPSVIRATLSLSQEEETVVRNMGLTYDEMDDGSILFDEEESAYDYHLTRQYPDGSQQRIWSCAPWMDPVSTAYWACAPNTVLWNPDTNVVTWGMFQTSTVVGIDLDSGDLLWELGEYPGGLAMDPEDIHLKLQHYPNWTPSGTLILTTHNPDVPKEQHIREFSLDLDGQVAHQVWDYVPAAGYYGEYVGEAQRMPGGNTMVGFGTDGAIQEVTPDKQVVWELDWSNHMAGHVTAISDLYALDQGW